MNSSNLMGVVGSVSESRQFDWKIPDFFSLLRSPDISCESPEFSASGHKWKLRIVQMVHELTPQAALLYLIRVNPDSLVERTVRVACGIRKSDGTLQEVQSPLQYTMDSPVPVRCCDLPNFETLKEYGSEMVPCGTLTITCRMEADEPDLIAVEEVSENRPKLQELEALSTNFQDLFVSKKKCDVILKVQGREFEAHRSILMARSSVLSAMFEHDTKEAQEGVVSIPDCDSEAFEDFLRYLYTGTLQNTSFWDAYNLYTMADKYDVEELKSFCQAYMAENLTTENYCDVAVLADRYCDQRLMFSIQMFFNENSKRIFTTLQWFKLMKENTRLASSLLARA